MRATILPATAAVKSGRIAVRVQGTGQRLSVPATNLEKVRPAPGRAAPSAELQELAAAMAGPALRVRPPPRAAPKAAAGTATAGAAEADAAKAKARVPQHRTPVWSFSEEKMASAQKAEGAQRAELWERFLAGDDKPVGGDGLPPPESQAQSSDGRRGLIQRGA